MEKTNSSTKREIRTSSSNLGRWLFCTFTITATLILGVASSAVAQDAPLQIPTSGTVTQLYNQPSTLYASGRHSGVDIAGSRSINDSNPVFAAAAGKVVYISHTGDYGDHVV